MTKKIYAKNTIEFVAVAVEFCSFLERAYEQEKATFVDTCTKLLPLLYLKASMLPTTATDDYIDSVEESVSEDMYEYIRTNISSLLKDSDTFLEVFHEDMQYSETPIVASISENLADIYQDIKNFTTIYSYQNEDTMELALQLCVESFIGYWGLKAANTLRAIHITRYSQQNPDDNSTSHSDEDEMHGTFFDQQLPQYDSDINNNWYE